MVDQRWSTSCIFSDALIQQWGWDMDGLKLKYLFSHLEFDVIIWAEGVHLQCLLCQQNIIICWTVNCLRKIVRFFCSFGP